MFVFVIGCKLCCYCWLLIASYVGVLVISCELCVYCWLVVASYLLYCLLLFASYVCNPGHWLLVILLLFIIGC